MKLESNNAVTTSSGRLDQRVVIIQPGTCEPTSGVLNADRVLLLSVLVLAPLALGAVQPWFWTGMSAAVAILLLLWALSCSRAATVKFVWSPLYIPMLALLSLATVQQVFGLSIDHIATREAVIKLMTYIAIFFLAQQLFFGRSLRVWRGTAAAVTVYAFGLAVFAIAQFFLSPNLIFGTVPSYGTVFGPYVNHNDYAGLMEMLIPLGVGLVIGLRPKDPARGLLGFMLLVAVVSVCLSGSRGGLIALVGEFALFGTLMIVAGRSPKTILLKALAVMVLAGGFFFWLDAGDVWARWVQAGTTPGLALGDRQKLASDSLHMLRDHVVAGVGLGGFEVAYPKYQTVVTDLMIDYAHNDYLQFLGETGLIGGAIMTLAIILFFPLAFGKLHFSIDDPMVWIKVGAAVGVIGLLIHSFSDFNLHIPANAAWFTFATALATLPRRSACVR